jgi:hypothetical protein
MFIKKYFYKIVNKEKYYNYKAKNLEKEKIKIFKERAEKKIENIPDSIKNKKELSFLHSGHLGDIINSLPVIKELSKTHKCNLYIESNRPIPNNVKYNEHPSGQVFLNNKNTSMLLPLLKQQPYIQDVNEYNNESIDIDFNLFRELPLNFNLDSVRWYFHISGIHTDLSTPYLFVEKNNLFKEKIVIIRSIRRKNYLINYNFLKHYKNLLFIGLTNEYNDLKKEVPNLEFYDCKDFLEMTQIIQSSKFFLGNLSLGYTLAEGLKIPRLLEACPDFPLVYPNGKNAYDFYFQKHFEKFFDVLYKL